MKCIMCIRRLDLHSLSLSADGSHWELDVDLPVGRNSFKFLLVCVCGWVCVWVCGCVGVGVHAHAHAHPPRCVTTGAWPGCVKL